MLDLAGPGKKCLKCGHTRAATDPQPDYACPQCGAVYAKVEAAMRAKEVERMDASAAIRARAQPKLIDGEDGIELRANRALESSFSNMAHLVYVLYVLPFGLTTLIGLIVAYVMRGKAEGTWVESHFDWQIWTFWGSLIAGAVVLVLATLLGTVFRGAIGGAIVAMAIIGGLLLAVVIWVIYRVIKGWFNLFRAQAVA